MRRKPSFGPLPRRSPAGRSGSRTCRRPPRSWSASARAAPFSLIIWPTVRLRVASKRPPAPFLPRSWSPPPRRKSPRWRLKPPPSPPLNRLSKPRCPYLRRSRRACPTRPRSPRWRPSAPSTPSKSRPTTPPQVPSFTSRSSAAARRSRSTKPRPINGDRRRRGRHRDRRNLTRRSRARRGRASSQAQEGQGKGCRACTARHRGRLAAGRRYRRAGRLRVRRAGFFRQHGEDRHQACRQGGVEGRRHHRGRARHVGGQHALRPQEGRRRARRRSGRHERQGAVLRRLVPDLV